MNTYIYINPERKHVGASNNSQMLPTAYIYIIYIGTYTHYIKGLWAHMQQPSWRAGGYTLFKHRFCILSIYYSWRLAVYIIGLWLPCSRSRWHCWEGVGNSWWCSGPGRHRGRRTWPRCQQDLLVVHKQTETKRDRYQVAHPVLYIYIYITSIDFKTRAKEPRLFCWTTCRRRRRFLVGRTQQQPNSQRKQ